MPPLNLPLMVLGRPVKPVAFGLAVSMLTVFIAGISNTGVLGDSAWGDFLSGIAAVCVAGYTLGWAARSQVAEEWALALTAGVFITRSAYVWLLLGWGQPAAWLSLGSAIVAGGSFVLERLDPKGITPPGHP